MKIALIAPEFPPRIGGMERLAYGLARALGEELGRSNVLVICEPTRLPEDGIDTSSFRLLRSAAPHPPSLWRHLVDSGELASIDAVLGLNAALAPMADVLPCPISIYVHGNDLLRPWLACGPRMIEAFERPYLPTLRHALRRRSIRRALPKVARVFANSSNTAELVTRLAPSTPVTVVPPGVDDVFFQQHEPRPSSSPIELLTVTRLSSSTRRKNVDGLIRSLALLPDSLAVRLTVIGDGDDRERLESLAAGMGLLQEGKRQVRFLGSVELPALLEAYRSADLFILASLASAKDVEGFGIVYLEASAAGLPSLCSREGGSTDAVIDGENGWLIEDSSPRTIARAIERFDSQRQTFDRSTVRSVAEPFRWPRVARRIVESL